jgi:predicted RNA-binding Zn-ribbon protein involved in translation (DUF1610 family)
MRSHTLAQFTEEFPDEAACLDRVFQLRYSLFNICPECGARTKFYRVRRRKTYACAFCGYQLSPLAGTIFHKSSTALYKWFYAMFLFCDSPDDLTAKELQRQLGVTYKCAWLFAKHIRLAYEQVQRDNPTTLTPFGVLLEQVAKPVLPDYP